MNRQPIEWERIFTSYISEKEGGVLAAPGACRIAQTRDQTHATASTQATAVTTPDL